MDLSPTPEQQELRRVTREFVDRHIIRMRTAPML
jgi:hypothetical protein